MEMFYWKNSKVRFFEMFMFEVIFRENLFMSVCVCLKNNNNRNFTSSLKRFLLRKCFGQKREIKIFKSKIPNKKN